MTAHDQTLDRQLSAEIADYIHGSDGHDISELIELISPVGDCAIFGGMPRDFARRGRDAFNSDVDIVVDVAPGLLDGLLACLGGVRNRFGGYRLKHGRFDFDIWALQSTWAAASGHVEVRSLPDLVKTTFFDCDAVLYHCRTREIARSEQFWSGIEQRVVDINLEANPHHIGALARTLRVFISWQQDLAPRLASYLVDGIARNRDEIVDYTRRNSASLGLADGSEIQCALQHLYFQAAGYAGPQTEDAYEWHRRLLSKTPTTAPVGSVGRRHG